MTDYRIQPMPAPVAPALLALLREAEVSTIGHWRPWGFCDNGIAPVLPGTRLLGTAVTLALPERDSRLLYRALAMLRPGDVLMIDRLGDRLFACWGGVVGAAAAATGIAGAVIDGPCTDIDEVAAIGMPIWCRGVSARTSRLGDVGGRMNVPISVGGVAIMPGDAILGDRNGILVLSPDEIETEARRAIEHQAFAKQATDRLQRGEALADIVAAGQQ